MNPLCSISDNTYIYITSSEGKVLIKEISEDSLPHADTVVEWHIPTHTMHEILFCDSSQLHYVFPSRTQIKRSFLCDKNERHKKS